MTPSRTCAITGIHGYLGSILADAFEKSGWSVIGLTRTPTSGVRPERPFHLGKNVDPATLAGINTLIHCAYDFRVGGWDDIRGVNVEGTKRLYDAARQAHVERILTISTISAFPGCASLYGRAKLLIEEIAEAVESTIIRPGLVFGGGRGSMIMRLERLTRLPVIPLPDGGQQPQYLAHVADLSGLVRECAETKRPRPPLVTAACERVQTLREIMEILAAVGGRRPHFLSVPSGLPLAALRLSEHAGISLPFRSDSLVSLFNQNPQPDFGPLRAFGVQFRPLTVDTWNA